MARPRHPLTRGREAEPTDCAFCTRRIFMGIIWSIKIDGETFKVCSYDCEVKLKEQTQVKCPGCDVPITPDNAGGYRTFCELCVDAFPPLPNDGNGHLIAEGCRYPNFRWD